MTPSNNFFRWCFAVMLLATLFIGYILAAKSIFYGLPLALIGVATGFSGFALCERRAKLEEKLEAFK